MQLVISGQGLGVDVDAFLHQQRILADLVEGQDARAIKELLPEDAILRYGNKRL